LEYYERNLESAKQEVILTEAFSRLRKQGEKREYNI